MYYLYNVKIRLTSNFFCFVQNDDDVTCHGLSRVICTPLIVKYYSKVFETHIDRFTSLFRSFLFSSLRLLHLRCVFTDDSTYYTDVTALLRRLRLSRYIELLVGVRHVSIPSGLRRRLVTCRHQL